MFLDCWSSASLGVSFPEYRSPGPPCSWCKDPSWVSMAQLQGSTTGLVGQGHSELWNQPDLGKRLLLFKNFYSIAFGANFALAQRRWTIQRELEIYIFKAFKATFHSPLYEFWLGYIRKVHVIQWQPQVTPFIPHKMQEMWKQITNPSAKQPPPKNHYSLSLITPCTSEAFPKDQTNKWADCTIPQIWGYFWPQGRRKKFQRKTRRPCNVQTPKSPPSAEDV